MKWNDFLGGTKLILMLKRNGVWERMVPEGTCAKVLELFWGTVFLCQGCYDNCRRMGWLLQQEFIVSNFWMLEVLHQDIGRPCVTLKAVAFCRQLHLCLTHLLLRFLLIDWVQIVSVFKGFSHTELRTILIPFGLIKTGSLRSPFTMVSIPRRQGVRTWACLCGECDSVYYWI